MISGARTMGYYEIDMYKHSRTTQQSKSLRECSICGKMAVFYGTRCYACKDYLKRHGVERPESVYADKKCKSCGEILARDLEKTVQGLCELCFTVKHEIPETCLCGALAVTIDQVPLCLVHFREMIDLRAQYNTIY